MATLIEKAKHGPRANADDEARAKSRTVALQNPPSNAGLHRTSPPSSHSIMFGRAFSFLRSEELKNTGSLARDLLASERTFLAWARTGLGFIALGVALERVDSPALLGIQERRTKIASGMLLTSGTLCVAHGTQRYFNTLDATKRGFFKPNVAGITMMAAASIGLAFAGTLLVLDDGGHREKSKSE